MSTTTEDIEDDVRELMAAKEEVSSARAVSTHAMLAALQLTPANVDNKFQEACHFVAVVVSRLRRDPDSLEMRLWTIETHTNRLWALRQQALVGSCEASRGSKEYARVAAEDADVASARGITGWVPCCARMARESKLKLWQDLGEMPKLEAQLRYLTIVTELAPEWVNPLSKDSALLRTWTPDDDSDRCAICEEIFTFLNRRHHCRRCSSLVCAVCSPHSLPLRVFSQTSDKPQRICNTCFHEMEQQSSVLSSTASSFSSDSISITDPKATGANAQWRSQPSVYSFATDDDETEEAPAPYPLPSLLDIASSTISTSTAIKPSLQSLSATIQCGVLDFLHGDGFRKNWHTYFFVLLIRKGSLGMFLSETDHVEKKKRPAAVYKLSGYTIRIKSQKRRPHQFRLTHATKKPLHFAATSIEDMNLWISQLIKAVDNANDLEAQLSSPQGVDAVVTTVTTETALPGEQ